MDEKLREILKVVFIIGVVFIMGISSLYFIGVNAKDDIGYLQETIDSKQNVTDDYRQGWNDAINALKDFRLNNLATNASK